MIESITCRDRSNVTKMFRARPKPHAQAISPVSLFSFQIEPRYSNSAQDHEIEPQPTFENRPEKSIECLRRSKYERFESRHVNKLKALSFDGTNSWPIFFYNFGLIIGN